MKNTFWVGTVLAAALSLSAAFAQEVIITSPAPPPVVVPAPVLPPPAPPVITNSMIPGDSFMAPGMAAVSTPGGTVMIPVGGQNGYVIAPGGGEVHYWTDGYGTTYYQYYDVNGNRDHRHHL